MVDVTLFQGNAPIVMRDLMRDFGLDEVQTAGVLGNIGHECAGFHILHEIGQPEGRGGYGWCQWTGPRRQSFMSWCEDKHLNWKDYEANYGYLREELSGSEKRTISALLKTHTMEDAAVAFERNFEGAGVVNMDERYRGGRIALDAYRHPRP